MPRYIAAYKQQGTVVHAILDNQGNRESYFQNPHRSYLRWWDSSLCDSFGSYKTKGSIIEPCSNKMYEKYGTTFKHHRQFIGQTFNTKWVTSVDANKFNVCKKCATIITHAEKNDIPYHLLINLLLNKVQKTLWPKISSNINDVNITAGEQNILINNDVPVTEWVQFVEAWRQAEFNVDVTLFLYDNNVEYSAWDNFKNWPIEWVEAHYE